MDLRSAVTRAVESTRPLIDARRHRLHISMPPTPVTVHGDLTRLTQVVLNLLSNSAKYTPAGGDIWVDVDTDGRNAHVCVRDNGVGISPHVLANVFDLFAQGERTLDRSEGGLGIGLTLARRIIGLHGGSITANSAGPGQGAEFLATLPLLDLASGSAMPQPVTKPLARTARPRSILVVEDNEDAAASIAMLLGMVGHQVEIEANGAAVMGRVAAGGFEIVLLDIGLPGMSGYDVARALRASPEGHALRIYAMTGYGQEEDRKRSLASGFDGHLVKPVMPSDLITLIEQTSA
jgi:CheY-like chemotaxis protein